MKLLWICFVWPEPSSSAAGVRTRQLIDFFRDEKWKIHVCSPCQPNAHRENLIASGIETAHFEPNDSRFDEYVRELNPDVVFFDRFMIEEQFGWRVREQCPDALRILDTSDLHSIRRLRQNKFERGENALLFEDGELQTDDVIRELSSIYRSDLSLVVSDFERSLLQERLRVPAELVELSRIFYPEPRHGLSYEERKDFVMIGNFRHPPNLDAFRFLQRELWPLIRSKIQAELHLYGAYPTKELMDLDDPKTGFRVKGWAPDAVEALGRYRVNLAPLRFGAGIKGKILDGWAAGTPCVATAIGAEGIFTSPLREADWSGFAEAAVGLYSDSASWERVRREGMAILRRDFGRESVTASLLRRIQLLAAERNSARARNFVGAMLWHHGARSTEYFSRWIEAKSKGKQAT